MTDLMLSLAIRFSGYRYAQVGRNQCDEHDSEI